MDTSRHAKRPPEPRVLYGRVAVYAATLLLAFVVGTLVGGRSGADEHDVALARAEVAELRQANYALEQQVAAYAAGQVLPPGQDPQTGTTEEDVAGSGAAEDGETTAAADETGPEVAAEDGDTTATSAPPGSTTYEVQAGDTLTSIAERVYGDGSQFTLIAAANGVDAQLEIGQELIIPPAPEPEAEPASADTEAADTADAADADPATATAEEGAAQG